MKRRIGIYKDKILVEGAGTKVNNYEIAIEDISNTGSNDDSYCYFISNNIDLYDQGLFEITGIIFSGTSLIDRTLVMGTNIKGIAYQETSLSEFSDHITPNNNISIAAFRFPKQFICMYTDDNSINHSVLVKLDAIEALFLTWSDIHANSKEEAEQKFKEPIHSRIEEIKSNPEYAPFFFGAGTLEAEGMTINLPLFRECTKEEYYSLAQ